MTESENTRLTQMMGQRHHPSSYGNQTTFNTVHTEDSSHMSLSPHSDEAQVKAFRSVWIH